MAVRGGAGLRRQSTRLHAAAGGRLDGRQPDAARKTLERVTASAFGQRRKMLRQSLKTLGVDAIALCAKAGVDPTARAETLSVEEFCALANVVDGLG